MYSSTLSTGDAEKSAAAELAHLSSEYELVRALYNQLLAAHGAAEAREAGAAVNDLAANGGEASKGPSEDGDEEAGASGAGTNVGTTGSPTNVGFGDGVSPLESDRVITMLTKRFVNGSTHRTGLQIVSLPRSCSLTSPHPLSLRLLKAARGAVRNSAIANADGTGAGLPTDSTARGSSLSRASSSFSYEAPAADAVLDGSAPLHPSLEGAAADGLIAGASSGTGAGAGVGTDTAGTGGALERHAMAETMEIVALSQQVNAVNLGLQGRVQVCHLYLERT